MKNASGHQGDKTLWERILGRGRTKRMILLRCVIAAKQLSSYPTAENISFTLYYFCQFMTMFWNAHLQHRLALSQIAT